MFNRVAYFLIAAFALISLSNAALATDDWLKAGRIAGTYIYNAMSQEDLAALLDQRAAENVSIVELDSRLSYYLNDAEFGAEVSFLDLAAQEANARGMKAVIYYPTFEVLTANAIDENGVIAASTMAKDHPDWVQQGIDGTPNVFYGGQEVWVSPGEESAWLSPNSAYKDYFIDRIEQLAATNLDGVWLDVPIYLDTGTLWTGAEPGAAADFQAWTIANGHNSGAGYSVPTVYNMGDPGFRAWIKWRHINIANFLNDVRSAAQAVNPNFAVIVENFPLDYFDSTAYGLDGSFLPVEDNFLRVWETDNVSNTLAMQWATPDDFENKIAMLKWGKSVHPTNPSWSFSYGNETLDAGLTMAATVASHNVPFESKTPTMLNTVDTNFRQNWFGYIKDHEAELFNHNRSSSLAIWYSSATRDFQDYDQSGKFGLYSVTDAPLADDTWWAKNASDSVVTAPHLGGYRGMSAAMIRMNIPYTMVHGRDAGPINSAGDFGMLILPSVGALSDADAAYIRNYVQTGGVLLATGELPGTLDETGQARSSSAIADLFSFPNGVAGPRVNQFGNGLAIYRPDIVGKDLFGEQLNANVAASTLSEIERLVRIHVDEPFTLENGENIYADHAIASDSEHLVYLVNYDGLQLPLVKSAKTVTVHYKAPMGKMITSVVASTPDADGFNGFTPVISRADGIYEIEVAVDQFSLLKISLANAPADNAAAYAGPQFDDPLHAEAAQSGLDFVLNSMRNDTLPIPNRYGVHTNLLDNEQSTEIYTNGHHVTGEHMGLLLRTSACMGNEQAFDEAYQYVTQLMQSPLYQIPNWSIDKNEQRPFLFFDDYRTNWFNANAPLDDLRLIHGLVDGHENFGRSDANDVANSMFEGLLWTSVTDRSRNTNDHLFPDYAGGLLGFAWDWSETDDNTLSPAPATATGTGYLGTDLLPVDYQDLGAIAHAAARDHRWEGILASTTKLLLDSEINLSGLYFNGYRPNGDWTGDFEYQGTRRGEHLKTIQVLWTGIHLARAAQVAEGTLSEADKSLAAGSAARSLAFFKAFYQTNGRVPEYLTTSGTDVDQCVAGQPADCLDRASENLFEGEARIYAQIARLALLLSDQAFANQMINEKILTDRVDNVTDPLYGMIGVSTAGANDAEAWNILESVFSICLNALNDDDGGTTVNNNPPVANSDNYATNEETPLALLPAELLSNDTDADGDTLIISGLASRSAAGGSVDRLDSGEWRYTPPPGFTGTDEISYAISDQQGGTAIGQITIVVRLVTKTNHLAETVTITSGQLNYGSVEFLTSDDIDTYDIDSANSADGHVVDWYVTGQIENREQVSRLVVTYSGHYSVANVEQETFLYDFTNLSWVSLDVRTVGNETDSVVQLDVTDTPQKYIASDGSTRLRVRGFHTNQMITVWANSVNWLAHRGADSGNGNPPSAVNLSASTTTDSATEITLQSSGNVGDSPIYTINENALIGVLTGVAPNLTYTPASGFSGTDTFTYTVSNGEQTSQPATVSISVLASGVVSNLATAITLDGSLTDWSAFLPFADDPDDVVAPGSPLDWIQAWMAHDGGYYYLAYRNDGPVNVSWGQTIYFDIDNNTSTGYQQGLPIGADRVLQGRFLYSYTGTGSQWSWDYITEVVGTSADGDFEYRFPRTALGDSELIQLVFVGSNEPFGGVEEDLYPDSLYDASGTNRFFTYTATAPTNSAPIASNLELATIEEQTVEFNLVASDSDGDTLSYTILSLPENGSLTGNAPSLSYQAIAGFTGTDTFTFQVDDGELSSPVATVTINVNSETDSQLPYNPITGLTIDGLLTEWATLRSFSADPDDITGTENPVDYLSATMAHDLQNFYISVTNDGEDLDALPNWLYTVYLDTDNNANTGYKSGLAIGADYMQQGSGVYSYNGSGLDWIWTAQAPSARAAVGASMELSIPRHSIGDPSDIKLVFIGDNFSVGGSVEDVYPDGTYNENAAVRYLEYTTNGDASGPAIGAAFESLPAVVSGREERKRSPIELSRQSELENTGVTRSGQIRLFELLMASLLFLLFGLYRRTVI